MLDALNRDIGNSVVRKVEVLTDRGFKFFGGDCRSVSIESPLKCSLSFSNILDTTDSTGEEIDNIGSLASDVTSGLVCRPGDMACKRVSCSYMIFAYYTFGVTFERAMTDGRDDGVC